LLVAFATSGAHADETHYQTLLIGQRALGMGGAATGVADEPSAAFYNPGGLALLLENSVSGNLSVNAYDVRIIDDAYRTERGDADFETRSRPAVPIFGTVVKKWGRRGEDGIRPHALAITTIVPIRRRLRYQLDLQNDETSESLLVDREDRVIYQGASLSLRLAEEWSIGASLFGVIRRFRHREDQVIITNGVLDTGSGTWQNSTLFVRETQTELRTIHGLFRLGAVYTPTPHWRLGLMFQPPGFELSQSARVRERIAFGDQLADPGYSTFFFSDQGGLDASSPIPWELRIGGSYAHSDSFLVAADVSVHGGGEVRRIGDRQPDPLTGGTPQTGDFFADDWTRVPQVNFSVGMEAILGPVPLRLGFFTDRSAAQRVVEESFSYQPEHVDRYGATFSIGFRDETYDLTVGVAALFGNGTAMAYDPTAGGAPYVPTDVRDRMLYFFVSGAQKSAGRFAQRQFRRIRDRIRERREDDDGGDAGAGGDDAGDEDEGEGEGAGDAGAGDDAAGDDDHDEGAGDASAGGDDAADDDALRGDDDAGRGDTADGEEDGSPDDDAPTAGDPAGTDSGDAAGAPAGGEEEAPDGVRSGAADAGDDGR